MSDDWAVGDLAVCVDAGPFQHPRFVSMNRDGYKSLTCGAVYTVTGVVVERSTGLQGLHLAELPSDAGWLAERFRKIRPDAREGNADDWREITKLHTRKVRA